MYPFSGGTGAGKTFRRVCKQSGQFRKRLHLMYDVKRAINAGKQGNALLLPAIDTSDR